MALSKSDRRKLAEIEKYLGTDEPELARILTHRPQRTSWRLVTTIAISVIVATTALPAGVGLNGGPAGPLLFVLGSLALLTALTTGAWMLWTSIRPPAKHNTSTQDEPRHQPATGPWRNPSSWWLWWT